jgi:putative endonuclease
VTSRQEAFSEGPLAASANMPSVADAFVYLLRCADGSLYCGWTSDPERRLRQHSAGTASRYTKRRLPVEYVLVMPAADRSAALREEARIKRLPRREKLALIGSARQSDHAHDRAG